MFSLIMPGYLVCLRITCCWVRKDSHLYFARRQKLVHPHHTHKIYYKRLRPRYMSLMGTLSPYLSCLVKSNPRLRDKEEKIKNKNHTILTLFKIRCNYPEAANQRTWGDSVLTVPQTHLMTHNHKQVHLDHHIQ